MNKTEIKKIMREHMNSYVTIKYNLGRNKYESYQVKIKELYNNVFTVELKKDKQVKSFSYSDIITKTIRIEY